MNNTMQLLALGAVLFSSGTAFAGAATADTTKDDGPQVAMTVNLYFALGGCTLTFNTSSAAATSGTTPTDTAEITSRPDLADFTGGGAPDGTFEVYLTDLEQDGNMLAVKAEYQITECPASRFDIDLKPSEVTGATAVNAVAALNTDGLTYTMLVTPDVHGPAFPDERYNARLGFQFLEGATVDGMISATYTMKATLH
jgi:hypothetical protein